jgi:hypothetical protein
MMREISEVGYITSTVDSGISEHLYAGQSLADAAQAALAYQGNCSIKHYRYDGTVRDVMDYEGGKATVGYVYE